MSHVILVAQDALKAILDARAAWDNVDIRDGGPTEHEDISGDMFWFNDVAIPEDNWASLGAPSGGNRRRLTFNLGFTIMVRTYGDEERVTRAQALALYEDFQAAVKANPALGVPASVQTLGATTGTLSSAPVDPQTWGAWFTGTLAVTSRAY
jgi:hypothetical protein